MLRFSAASRSASKKRKKYEKDGEHVPPFLIASITSSCNLHCAGCYSRCSSATVDSEPVSQLSTGEWSRIFDEADELGISFILLAGGEPMLSRDVIEAASKRRNILFPVFTNGTYMDAKYFELFGKCRNLLPVMSIEGGKEITDASPRNAASFTSIPTEEPSRARFLPIPTSTSEILPYARQCARLFSPRCATEAFCPELMTEAACFSKSGNLLKSSLPRRNGAERRFPSYAPSAGKPQRFSG